MKVDQLFVFNFYTLANMQDFPGCLGIRMYVFFSIIILIIIVVIHCGVENVCIITV